MNTRVRLDDRKKSLAFWAHVCGAFVFLFPLTLQKLDYRTFANGGLAVRIHKSSPAYAAFEDIREDYMNPLEDLKTEPTQMIGSGQTFTKPIPKVEQRVLALSGITIRTPKPDVELKPVLVASLEEKILAEPRLTDLRGDLLPLVERKRRLIDYYGSDELKTRSARELAKDLIQEELRNSENNAAAASQPTFIPTQSGQPIMVARSSSRPPETGDPVTDDIADDNAQMDVLSFVNPNPEAQRPLVLAGQIEMKDGLAFTGSDTALSVKRLHQGQSYEVGRIWIREGRFEIRVKQAVGRLVAELTNRGEIIGRGEIDLLDLQDFPLRSDKVEGLKIPIKPTSEGTSLQIVSGYSYGNHKFPLARAKIEIDGYTDATKVDDDGRVTDQSLAKNSSFIVKAESPKHFPTMMVGTTDAQSEVRLFSRKMITALTELALDKADRKEALQHSIVWGRVLVDGKPVTGAQVDLADGNPPIYFNEVYLPDRTLMSTSLNGVFAFLLVNEGTQAVRVTYKGKTFPAQIFPTENEVVSYVELQLQNKVSAQFNIYDMLDPSQEIAAHVRIVGIDQELPVNRDGFVEFPVAANPYVVEADAGNEFELARVTVAGKPDQIFIPTVKRKWLAELAQQAEIELAPQKGIITGVIEDQAFEVELSGYKHPDKMQIVFFDQSGSRIEGMRGVPGGGFAIFNAPLGMQTLVIHPQLTRKSFSQIVVAEPEFVQTLRYNFSR